MNKLNHLEILLKSIAKDGLEMGSEADRDFADVGSHTNTYIDYHNEAVSQGLQLTISGIRCGTEEQYIKYVERLHERRKALHQSMIDATVALNGLCAKYNVPPIYAGPLDAGKGRSDDDTRYGVAKFEEELCRDLFKTTETIFVSGKAREMYGKYQADIRSDYDAHGKRPDAPGAAFEMLRKAAAQSGMDSSHSGGELNR